MKRRDMSIRMSYLLFSDGHFGSGRARSILGFNYSGSGEGLLELFFLFITETILRVA